MRNRGATAGLLALALFGGNIAAKPPEVPLAPKVNGEVPPPSVQEFFTPGPTLPEPERLPSTPTRRNLPIVADLLAELDEIMCSWRAAHTVFWIEAERGPKALADTPLENLERITKAGQFFELGEALREVGEHKLATAAYRQAKLLAPGSRFAHMAEKRMEATVAHRVGGEAESEAAEAPMTTLRYGPFVIGIGKRSFSLGFVIDTEK